MPRQSIHLVLAVTMLLALSVVGALAMEWAADSGSTQSGWSAADDESDRPLTVRPGAEDPRAHQSETPRRVEAPERQPADFGRQPAAAPARRSPKASEGWALSHGAPGPNGSNSASPRHLRLCVFLC